MTPVWEAFGYLTGAAKDLDGGPEAVETVRAELVRLQGIEGRAVDVESRVNDSWTRPAPATARYILTGVES